MGEGRLEASLKTRAEELGVQGNVQFFGQRNDVRQLLQDSDAFVFPSLYEGCPNALLEALAMGLPCVASDIEPVAEVTQGGELASLVAI